MLQRIWHQLEQVGLSGNTIIATGKSQEDMIRTQIGYEIPLIIEPDRRDTFPAIALAASFLYSMKKIEPGEVIVTLTVDPYVETSFFERIKDLEQALLKSGAELALMGVEPSCPSINYGYILPKAITTNKEYFEVSHFKEKPTESHAEELIQSHAFWNCGIFAFKLQYIIDILMKRNLPTHYTELLQSYHLLPKISFDYEVAEKANKVIALPYRGFWQDLGTWSSLTQMMKTNQIGKGLIHEDCSNAHLINELEIPVIMLGVNNLIVAASPDGILVSEKEASPKVKDLLSDFEQRPMFEERRWGWYRVLDYTKFADGDEVLTKRIGVIAGKNLSYQQHFHRREVWTIIRGEGEFVLNGRISKVKPGDVLIISVGDKHAIKAITDLEFIEVQSGSQLAEEDIVRIFITWEEIEKSCILSD